jgi:phage tail P2-like protein
VSDLLPPLMPPNATPVERHLAATGAAIADIPIPLRDIGHAATCPANVLPVLAWERSVDRWDADWPDATKRAVINASFLVHQRKGTVGAIRRAIEPLGYRVQIVPWYEMQPHGRRGTFSLEIVATARGISAEMYEELKRLIDDAKPLSRHVAELTIHLEARGAAHMGGLPMLGDVITVHPRLSHPATVSGCVRHVGAYHVTDTLTVYPRSLPVTVDGGLRHASAWHLIDTVTVFQGSL